MTYTVKLTTFFRSIGDECHEDGPARYLAGFEDADGVPWGVAVPLDPDDVESAVFDGIEFSVSIETNGMLNIEAEGRSDLVNELIAASGEKSRSPLDAVVQSALQLDLLAMEDDALGELKALHDRLTNSLASVEDAIRSVEQ